MDPAFGDYELLDVGAGRRLERFGERRVIRPHPAALGPRADPAAWQSPSMTFETGRGWVGDTTPWQIHIAGSTVELRPTSTGQVGVFPEQAASVEWLRDRPLVGRELLNLFAYTGVVTLVAAALGASVAHVDASRPAVAWARRNAELSDLADRPIRWLVDDAAAFAAREVRRGHRYDGVILDPPSYGHGSAGRSWRIDRDLPALLDSCAALLSGPDGLVLLTAHTPGFDAPRLTDVLSTAVSVGPSAIEGGALRVTARSGRSLDLGTFARWHGRR